MALDSSMKGTANTMAVDPTIFAAGDTTDDLDKGNGFTYVP